MGGGDGCKTPGFTGFVDDKDADVDADKGKQEKISDEKWEEFLEALELYEWKLKFEKIYGPEPKVGRIFGWRKFSVWLDKFYIFVKGARVGEENAERVIMQSGWLTSEAQEMFERSAQKRRK